MNNNKKKINQTKKALMVQSVETRLDRGKRGVIIRYIPNNKEMNVTLEIQKLTIPRRLGLHESCMSVWAGTSAVRVYRSSLYGSAH